MEKRYQPYVYKGKIKAPFSKSYTQRAIAIGLLSKGETKILNPALCADTLAATIIAKNLGAVIRQTKNSLRVNGSLQAKSSTLSAGESGLAVRMFTPIAALLDKEIIITGEGSLLKRPVSMMEKPLNALGVQIMSNKGFLPISIQGPLAGGSTQVDGSISSQFLTGLLIALPLAKNGSLLEITNLKSVPYIDMTLEIMEHFGIKIINENYHKFKIKGNQRYIAKPYTIEGDWSNAAFHLVGGAISGQIEVQGLNPKSKQADIAILEALELAGADLSFSKQSIIVKKSNLRSFEFDATNCPDLFPPLAILAAASIGISQIKGANRLTHKESNRAHVLQKELGKIGIKAEIENNFLIVHGGKISGGILNSNNDHRIAMAGAIASLISQNPISIQQAEAVNKSYPDFYKDFENCRKS